MSNKLPTTDFRYSIKRKPWLTLFVDQGDKTVEETVTDGSGIPVLDVDGNEQVRKVKRPNPDGRWRWMVYSHTEELGWRYECGSAVSGFPTRMLALDHARLFFPPPGWWERHGV